MRLMRVMALPVLALSLHAGNVSASLAATELPFSRQAFDASQREGKPILVHIAASWCPNCAKQRPILAAMEDEAEFKDLVVYDVDFDTQKDIVRALGAQKQSTLIVFHGASEKGRSTGVTDATAIRMLLGKTGD